MVEHFPTTWWPPALTKRNSGAALYHSVMLFFGTDNSGGFLEMISREEHGDEFLKVTDALAERLANAGREPNAEEVAQPPL